MNVNIEKLENSRVKLSIDVDGDQLEEGLAHAYRKVVKQVTVPGFRKGKVPRPILERNFGVGILFEDAVDYLLPKLYGQAIEEKDIKPVGQPDISIDKIEPGVGFSFVAEVDVFPEVKLGEYKGVKVEKVVYPVTDEDVEKALESLRQRHSELVVVDSRTDVQEGDFANIDFKGYIDGEPFPGGAAEDYPLEIGSGQFIPGFEEQLIGMNVGEEKDIVVTFPENYGSKDLAGKDATFKVKIRGLKERLLPELDDEFAKDVSDFESLAELKADIREKLEEESTRRTKKELENKILEQIIANSEEIVLPNTLVEEQAEYLLNNFNVSLMYQGLNLEKYAELAGTDEETIKEDMRAQAAEQIKKDLILSEIIKVEGITATEEEVNNKLEEMVKDSYDPENARHQWESRKRDLEISIKMEKCADFLIEHAEVTEVIAEEESSVEDSE